MSVARRATRNAEPGGISLALRVTPWHRTRLSGTEPHPSAAATFMPWVDCPSSGLRQLTGSIDITWEHPQERNCTDGPLGDDSSAGRLCLTIGGRLDPRGSRSASSLAAPYANGTRPCPGSWSMQGLMRTGSALCRSACLLCWQRSRVGQLARIGATNVRFAQGGRKCLGWDRCLKVR